jgi:spoIIIJ-associated protein
MNPFKEFQGRDLDSAIDEACDYFNLAREKLEIEILQDAKSGIFGIVGARKAKIRARRVQLPETLKNLLGNKASEEASPDSVQPALPDVFEAAATQEARPGKSVPAKGKAGGKGRRQVGKSGNGAKREMPSPDEGTPPALAVEESADDFFERGIAEDDLSDMDDMADAAPEMPRTPLEEIDADRLKSLVTEAAAKIITGIVGERPEIAVDICRDRVRVKADCAQDSGLLIGREGQTLSAVQYLLSRMVSRSLDAAVRVQMDAGDYRRKQEDKLRALAIALADKARRSGRPLSTRPLSSYHRRIVHLSLQNVSDIQTRSIGDGSLKRVVIQRQKVEK